MMVGGVYDIKDMEKNHELHGNEDHFVAAVAVTIWGKKPIHEQQKSSV